MTLREVYENVLTELNKRKAPSLLLADFNYYVMKGIYSYINIRYLAYDKDQQSVDDLGALKIVSAPITLSKTGLQYKGSLPSDYLHILNCKVEFEAKEDYSCYEAEEVFEVSAQRLPTGAANHVERNHYFKPSYKLPYFYDHPGQLEIRAGKDDKVYPKTAYIDYLKTPVVLVLTDEQVEEVADTSQTLEFSHLVCLQIINEIIKLVLEHDSNPRLQTNIPVNQTIPPNR